MTKTTTLICLALLALIPSITKADFIITLESTSTTYSTLLTFDEIGGPTGDVATDAFLNIGIDSFIDTDPDSGGLVNVGNHGGAGESWLGTDNSAFGSFGIVFDFTNALTDFNAEYQDSSDQNFAGVFVSSNGVLVAQLFIDPPAWGGTGDSFVNIQATGGDTFDQVEFASLGAADARSFVDDVSFNSVPEPGSSIILVLAMTLGVRRRRC